MSAIEQPVVMFLRASFVVVVDDDDEFSLECLYRLGSIFIQDEIVPLCCIDRSDSFSCQCDFYGLIQISIDRSIVKLGCIGIEKHWLIYKFACLLEAQ